jgi:RNA polymerase sigma factor (sigma-70 family)
MAVRDAKQDLGGVEAAAVSDVERERSIASLFRDHNRALVSFLTLRLQSVQEAKEVAQEAYVRLLQLDRPEVHSFLRAYLFRIASNIAVDRLRRRGTERRAAQAEVFDELDDVHEPERISIASEQLDLVRRCLEELPANCRDAFLLHRIEGMSVEAIAARMNISSRMVYLHLDRALVYCRLRSDGASAEQVRQRMKR